jgi:hypothetical protein
LEEHHLDALRNHHAVVGVESRMPSLEEIFVAYMRGEKQEALRASPEAEAVESHLP